MEPKPWICPNCGRGKAPHVDECECVPAKAAPVFIPTIACAGITPDHAPTTTIIGDLPGSATIRSLHIVYDGESPWLGPTVRV